MTEHALLYAIAIATGISALAWVVVVVGGIKMARELSRVERELKGELREVLDEALPLIREVRGTVSEVRGFTRSGREITEEVVSALLLRRVSRRWLPTRKTAKVGASLLRQGIHGLRGWLRTRHEAELASTDGMAMPVLENDEPEPAE
ncbi:MAG: hypothetical protein ACOCVQ_01055 [Bacillota bacterium]